MAHYFIAQIAETGYVPVVDFRAPEEPHMWDTTAAACAACGLMEIAEHVPDWEKAIYQRCAERILLALSDQHCDWDVGNDGILQHGTVAYHRERNEIEVPIIYGDYFFTEGILRLLGRSFMIW